MDAKFSFYGAELIFAATIIITFIAAALGRKHSRANANNGLTEQKLNRWLIGLSAGATANSGFVVTGAVGLGYAYGPQWIFLPLAWLIGDLVFWRFFPARINAVGAQSKATTLSELLSDGISGPAARVSSIFATLLIVVCLGGYTSAQWLAGQKFLAGAFAIPDVAALALFACIIIAYTMIGGFRGSVYADTVQAIIRIVGTIIALIAILSFVASDTQTFNENIQGAGPGFMQVIPGTSLITSVGFILGYGSAALGFGLGQPQIVSRYLAGSSPDETEAARWIYIGFVQFTWIAMTIFGVLLRGVIPDLADPETGLSAFFMQKLGPILTGIIVADIFATIAATSNSLLISMAQAVSHDLLPSTTRADVRNRILGISVIFLGALTMLGSYAISGQKTVFELALSSVALLGAGLAGPVMIKVLNWRRTSASLLSSIVIGVLVAFFWKYAGLSSTINESAAGIVFSLTANFLVTRFFQTR